VSLVSKDAITGKYALLAKTQLQVLTFYENMWSIKWPFFSSINEYLLNLIPYSYLWNTDYLLISFSSWYISN